MGGGVGNAVEGIGQKIGDLFGGNKNPKKGTKK
jgi:hypothetical protein